MAAPTNPQERRVIAIIDRHTAVKDNLLAALVKAILRVLARLLADEARELGIPARRPAAQLPPAPRLHSETGNPMLPPKPVELPEETPKRAQMLTPERMEKRREAARQIATLVARAETATANLIQAQNDAIARELGHKPTPSRSLYTGDRPRKVEPEVEWMRPVYRYLDAVEEGRAADEAARIAAEKVEIQAADDLNAASRAGMEDWMERNLGGVTGYRRVIHPELSEGGSCGLCIAASTRVYKKDRPVEFHARCKCGIVPIFDDQDIAQALNLNDLNEYLGRMYSDAGESTRAEDLKKTRYKVIEHSELGPQLRDLTHRTSKQASVSTLTERGSMNDNPALRRKRRKRKPA